MKHAVLFLTIVLAMSGCATHQKTLWTASPVLSDEGVQTVTLAYKTTPTRDMEITMYLPRDWHARDTRPAVVFFFGGGWRQGSVKQFDYQSRYLARRGMVAACADYRVLGKDNTGPDACVEDAKSAVRWMRANARRLGIDPNRLVAGGGSAGGHIAACTALTPGLDAAGEDLSVSSRPNALVLFNPVLEVLREPRILERLDNDEALARSITPSLYLRADAPPAILFYGDQDRLITHGEAFMTGTKAIGQRAEMHITAGQDHGFFNRPPYREETLLLVDKFLVELGYLKGERLAMPEE